MVQSLRPAPFARVFAGVAAVLAMSGILGASSCAASGHSSPSSFSGDSGDLNLGGGGPGPVLGLDGGVVTVVPCTGPCKDFPASPVLDVGAPANAASLFGPATNGAQTGGPCMLEPPAGALFPNNWTRPQFQIQPVGSQDLFEIRLHVAGEANDLVAYTKATTWKMPKDVWTGLAGHIQDTPITMTVRGLDSTSSSSMPSLGSSGTFTIAPASAAGAMVYWATSAFDDNVMNTQLQGFHVGEETVVPALQTTQVAEKVRATWGTSTSLGMLGTQVQCIGCHTATPDGANVAFTAQWPWPNALASVAAQTADASSVGQIPAFLTPQAQSNLSPNANGNYLSPPMCSASTPADTSGACVQYDMLGIQTFSKEHYAPGDRIVVTTKGSAWYRAMASDPGMATGVVAKLMWFDLETTSMSAGTGFGEIPRTGDSNSAVGPNWSHDGKNIVYASTDTGAEDGRMGQGNSDLAIVPYGDKQGGQVTMVPGASDPSYEEYYPAFSADDSLIAFNRVAKGLSMYIQPAAEVFVIPAAGGTATRLKANDPVACSGAVSPGAQNTLPKWAPAATAANGKTYHWLIFSSTRGTDKKAQLYVTGVVQDGTTIETYPAIYLWNQDPTLNNLIPAWDVFQIPPAPIQ
jgi:hypothetical protein